MAPDRLHKKPETLVLRVTLFTTRYAIPLLGSSGSGEGNEVFLRASPLVRVGGVYKHQVGIHWSPWTPAIATYLREDKSKYCALSPSTHTHDTRFHSSVRFFIVSN